MTRKQERVVVGRARKLDNVILVCTTTKRSINYDK